MNVRVAVHKETHDRTEIIDPEDLGGERPGNANDGVLTAAEQEPVDPGAGAAGTDIPADYVSGCVDGRRAGLAAIRCIDRRVMILPKEKAVDVANRVNDPPTISP
jgi:hypothetical protein